MGLKGHKGDVSCEMAHPSVDCPHFHSPHGDHSLFIVQMKALIIKREPSDDQQSTFFPPYMAIYYYSRYIQVHANMEFSYKVRILSSFFLLDGLYCKCFPHKKCRESLCRKVFPVISM